MLAVNALGPLDRGHYSIEISPAPSRYLPPPDRPILGPVVTAEEREPDDRVRQTVARVMQSYSSVTALMIGRLDAIPSLQFPAQRGRCYRGALVLGHRARLGAAVWMIVRSGRGSLTRGATPRSTERVVVLDDDLCASADGTLEIVFSGPTGRAVTVAGEGPFTLQIYSRAGGPPGP